MAAPILIVTGPPGVGKSTVARTSAVVHGVSFLDDVATAAAGPTAQFRGAELQLAVHGS